MDVNNESKEENQNKKSMTHCSPGKEWLKKKVKTVHRKLSRRI